MVDARVLTHNLGGKWYRRYGAAPCPICQPERRKGQNALTLADTRDGRLLAHCKKTHCNFAEILAAAGVTPGDYLPPPPEEQARRDAEQRSAAEKRARQAAQCWHETLPIAGTIAAQYLRNRRITCALPETLRFHPGTWHGPTATRHPALVALVEGGDGFAVHRTYLLPEGSGKAALDPSRMMLGAVAGGAVRLGSDPGALVVAEGIETALSLASGLLRAPATIWAALSTSGMRGLILPQRPGQLTLAPDGDPEGRAAAHALAERAHASGWRVSLLPAPDRRDWNDVLTMKGGLDERS
ncbi:MULTISPECIES: DUF7146 domain-containing protein [unclassified Marinovum]